MDPCKTCHQPLQPDANYCSACGAKVITERLTLKWLITNFLKSITNLDSPLLTTTKLLFQRPENVTISYIEGVRKVIHPPLRYALIILSVYGIFQFLFTDFLDLTATKSFLSGFKQGVIDNSDSPEKLLRKQRIFDLIDWFQSRDEFFNFLMIPFMSVLSFFLYRKQGLNMAEHTVIAIYAVSLSTLLTIMLGIILGVFSSEWAVDAYVTIGYFITFFSFIWIYYRTLKGSFFKPIVIHLASYTIIIVIFVLIVTVLLYA